MAGLVVVESLELTEYLWEVDATAVKLVVVSIQVPQSVRYCRYNPLSDLLELLGGESYPPGLHHFKQFVVQPIRSSSVRPEIKRKVISRFQSNNVIPGIAKYQYCRVPASF